MALRLIQVCRRCFHPKKIMNHRKQEYTRRLKPKKAKGMHLAGTQALDSSWKSTKKSHPDTLRLKDADTGQVNEEILDWVFSYAWRKNVRACGKDLGPNLAKVLWQD